MDGRWTLQGLHGTAATVRFFGGPALHGGETVAVVPCDGPAVERAVAAAEAEWDRIAAADEVDSERKADETPQAFLLRKAMEAGFRAAGEMP